MKLIHILLMRFRAKKLGIKYRKGISIGKGIKRHNKTRIIMSEYSILGPNIDFWGGGTVVLGKNSSIGRYSWVYANKNGGITIGDDVLCASHLYITDTNHNYLDKGTKIRLQGTNCRPVVIKDNVWIGAKVTILQGTEIGTRSVVGACSLLNDVYTDNSVIAGVPARVVKKI